MGAISGRFDQNGFRRKLRAEAESVWHGRAATGADVEQSALYRQIIDETLRLYSASGIISRHGTKARLSEATEGQSQRYR